MDCSPQGSSVPGISQARVLEQIAISFFRGIFPTQGSNLSLLHWQVDSLLLSYQGSLLCIIYYILLCYVSETIAIFGILEYTFYVYLYSKHFYRGNY